jgi:hypothetical protein
MVSGRNVLSLPKRIEMQLPDVDTQCVTPARLDTGRVTDEGSVDGVINNSAAELMAIC